MTENKNMNFNDLEQWELIVSLTMVPEHAAVTAKEAELDKFAKKFGGHNDGWGVMQHQDGDDESTISFRFIKSGD